MSKSKEQRVTFCSPSIPASSSSSSSAEPSLLEEFIKNVFSFTSSSPSPSSSSSSSSLFILVLSLLRRYLSQFMRKFSFFLSFLLSASPYTVICLYVFYRWLKKELKKRMFYHGFEERTSIHVFQAALYIIENFRTLRRVEKRALFESKLSDVFFDNETCRRVMNAACKTTEEEPCLLKFLPSKDRWYILNIVQNKISSFVGPHHLFFDQRTKQKRVHYKSSWYVFTLMCHKYRGKGRYLVTPSKKVDVHQDVPIYKIRAVLVDEKTLREIGCGFLGPPTTFFSERHFGRWKVVARVCQLYVKQFCFEIGEFNENRLKELMNNPNWNGTTNDNTNHNTNNNNNEHSQQNNMSSPPPSSSLSARNSCNETFNKSVDDTRNNNIRTVRYSHADLPSQSNSRSNHGNNDVVLNFESPCYSYDDHHSTTSNKQEKRAVGREETGRRGREEGEGEGEEERSPSNSVEEMTDENKKAEEANLQRGNKKSNITSINKVGCNVSSAFTMANEEEETNHSFDERKRNNDNSEVSNSNNNVDQAVQPSSFSSLHYANHPSSSYVPSTSSRENAHIPSSSSSSSSSCPPPSSVVCAVVCAVEALKDDSNNNDNVLRYTRHRPSPSTAFANKESDIPTEYAVPYSHSNNLNATDATIYEHHGKRREEIEQNRRRNQAYRNEEKEEEGLTGTAGCIQHTRRKNEMNKTSGGEQSNDEYNNNIISSVDHPRHERCLSREHNNRPPPHHPSLSNANNYNCNNKNNNANQNTNNNHTASYYSNANSNNHTQNSNKHKEENAAFFYYKLHSSLQNIFYNNYVSMLLGDVCVYIYAKYILKLHLPFNWSSLFPYHKVKNSNENNHNNNNNSSISTIDYSDPPHRRVRREKRQGVDSSFNSNLNNNDGSKINERANDSSNNLSNSNNNHCHTTQQNNQQPRSSSSASLLLFARNHSFHFREKHRKRFISRGSSSSFPSPSSTLLSRRREDETGEGGGRLGERGGGGGGHVARETEREIERRRRRDEVMQDKQTEHEDTKCTRGQENSEKGRMGGEGAQNSERNDEHLKIVIKGKDSEGDDDINDFISFSDRCKLKRNNNDNQLIRYDSVTHNLESKKKKEKNKRKNKNKKSAVGGLIEEIQKILTDDDDEDEEKEEGEEEEEEEKDEVEGEERKKKKERKEEKEEEREDERQERKTFEGNETNDVERNRRRVGQGRDFSFSSSIPSDEEDHNAIDYQGRSGDENDCCCRIHIPFPILKSLVDEEELAEIKGDEEFVVYRMSGD